MNLEKENLFLEQVFLSNIELYYTSLEFVKDSTISINGEEFQHAFKVMRNSIDEVLFTTDGCGKIYKTRISNIQKDFAELIVEQIFNYENKLRYLTLYIPNLKNSDRFEFALEKCVELGITNFVVYNSDRTFAKGFKLDRWNKIALAAMKQSLRAFLPKIGSLEHLKNLDEKQTNLLLDQGNSVSFDEFFYNKNEQNIYNLIIGPEGGFSDREYEKLKDSKKLKLTPNRLRSETASIACAVLLNGIFE